MDVDVYVAARRGRLVERAIDLGCPEDLASEHVERVLHEQRRRIRKAEDPDPIVLDALAKALTDEPARKSRRGPLAVAGLVAVGVGVAVAVTYEPPTRPVPSLFGYDQRSAETFLEAQGYDVRIEPSQVCEPVGQVLGSWPPAGEQVEQGSRVTVYTAVPAGFFCAAYYLDRQDAWEFVRFALGGAAPRFASSVDVAVDDGEATTLRGREAQLQERWGESLGLVAAAARATAQTGTRMPRLTVTPGPRIPDTCGLLPPLDPDSRAVLRLQIDPRSSDDETGCPLTIDLQRSDRVIESVVFYSPVTPT
jgi:PASTA domain